MYSGDNKTALTSQRLITDALLNLLKVKSFSDISISELCKEAQVSRQTFYTLFESKENIIIFEFKNKYPFVIEDQNNKNKITLQDLSSIFSLYINNNYDFFKLIIDNGLAMNLFNNLYKELLSCKRIISEEHNANREYIALFIASGLISIVKSYVNRGSRQDNGLLDNLIFSLFSGKFFNY